MSRTEADILMWEHISELAPYEDFVKMKEFCFFQGRKWRADFAIIHIPTGMESHLLLIEIEGGVWVRGGGGHNRGKSFLDDMEKYNHASLSGWRLLRFTPDQVLRGEAISFIKKVLES